MMLKVLEYDIFLNISHVRISLLRRVHLFGFLFEAPENLGHGEDCLTPHSIDLVFRLEYW